MFQVRIVSRRSLIQQLVLVPVFFLLILLVVETDSFSIPPPGQANKHFHCFQCQAVASTSTFPAVESTSTYTPHSPHSRNVVLPGHAFPDTKPGELSVTSCNLLAPFYHSLALDDLAAREDFATADRLERFPLALKLAKQTNADILLLQEVEGGALHEPQLEALLGEPTTSSSSSSTPSTIIPGYDSYLWAPLLPNKPEHVVGLCIAWRSSKHRLESSDSYKRGMICQFSEVPDDENEEEKEEEQEDDPSPQQGTFAIANVHLPARPSSILHRLVTMSKTIQKLTVFDVPERTSPLDGLLMVGGDWNCDQDSVTARLVTDGKVPYGNVRDRNYKANISKAVAGRMKHGYRFRDIYGDDAFRQEYAPVTVSLHGRGPGTMDHIFYTQQAQGPKHRASQDAIPKVVKVVNSNKGGGSATTGRRKARREKAIRMRRARRGGAGGSSSSRGGANIQVTSLLATVAGSEDTERLDIIYQGLPNVEAGFPSDHMPVGALFVPRLEFGESPSEDQVSSAVLTTSNVDKPSTTASPSVLVGGISSSVRRRREAGLQSLSIRKRHNVVLRCVAEWLEQCGAQEIIRDLPLYKNYWTQGATGLTKKSRAPDIVCRIQSTLAVVEVTVVSPARVEAVARQKRDKYSDLPEILPSSPTIEEAGLTVASPIIIVLDESGAIPESTRQSLDRLAAMLLPNDPEAAKIEAQRCYDELQYLF
jgi:hypothetical protein